jgi:Tfp pilus assembly protein PilF
VWFFGLRSRSGKEVESTRLVKFKERKAREMSGLGAVLCGVVALHNDRPALAVEICSAVKEETPEALLFVGLAELERNNPKAALVVLDEALQRIPELWEAHVFRQLAAADLGDQSVAQDATARLLRAQIEPEAAKRLQNYVLRFVVKRALAVLQGLSDNFATAAETMRDAAAKWERGTEALNAYMQAREAYEAGDLPRAQSLIEKSLVLNAEDLDANLLMARVLAKSGDPRRASELLSQIGEGIAVEKAGEVAAIRFLAGERSKAFVIGRRYLAPQSGVHAGARIAWRFDLEQQLPALKVDEEFKTFCAKEAPDVWK